MNKLKYLLKYFKITLKYIFLKEHITGHFFKMSLKDFLEEHLNIFLNNIF